jgi:hypothetical protein
MAYLYDHTASAARPNPTPEDDQGIRLVDLVGTGGDELLRLIGLVAPGHTPAASK